MAKNLQGRTAAKSYVSTRGRPLRFALPPMNTAADAVGAIATIAAAVAEAEITPGEANDLASLVQAFVNSLQGNEFDQRLRFLEERRNDAIRQI